MKQIKLIPFAIVLTLTASYSCFFNTLFAQNVGISNSGATPHASALLDIESSTKGLLIPRLALTTTNSAAPVISPAISLLIFNTATAGAFPNEVKPGYYYWSGAKWDRFQTGSQNDWNIIGNTATNSAFNFLGTADAQPLIFKTNNAEAMRITTTGNVGIGTPTPHPSAKLELKSTNQGFLLTRVDTISITGPAFGLMTLSPADTCLYMYNGNRWAKIGGGGKKCKCKTF
ncbi:MAG: hypothetical protein H7331_09470 [Bacteroidia bacterium]|nr:hypothetical protein [Bacteroidia bacterium]